MFDILSGIGSLINPASAIASTVLGQLFGEDQQQTAPPVMYPQAPPQQVIVQEPPPPPVHPLVQTGYFSNAYAQGGLVTAPGPLSQFLTTSPTMIQGQNGRELPALQATNPGFSTMAGQLNQWLSGDLSFMSPVGYAEGGQVQGIPPEIMNQPTPFSRQLAASNHNFDQDPRYFTLNHDGGTTAIRADSKYGRQYQDQVMGGAQPGEGPRGINPSDAARGVVRSVQAEAYNVQNMPDEMLIQSAMQAIAGVAPNGDEILQEFTTRFGEQALMDLASRAKSMGNVVPTDETNSISSLDEMTSQVSDWAFGQDPSMYNSGNMYQPLSGYPHLADKFNRMQYQDNAPPADGYIPYDQTFTSKSNPKAQTFTNDWAAVDTRKYASGGYVSDGLSDSIPAMINGSTPAALSDGEFVMPADVVSGIGNGSTNAGAKRLMEMIENVRRARTGRDAAPPKIKVER